MGQRWVKMRNFKSDPAPFGMLKQVCLAHFKFVVTRFGQGKIPKLLENGPFWDQDWGVMGQKRFCPKSDVEDWGCTNK